MVVDILQGGSFISVTLHFNYKLHKTIIVVKGEKERERDKQAERERERERERENAM